jgi:hypothetical protein
MNSYTTTKISFISLLIFISIAMTCIATGLICRKYDFKHSSATPDRDKSTSGNYSYTPIKQDNEEIVLSKLAHVPHGESEAYNDESDGSEHC